MGKERHTNGSVVNQRDDDIRLLPRTIKY